MSKTTRTRSKTRLSRALGIALTPKAAKYMENDPTDRVSTAAPSARVTLTTQFVCVRSSVFALSMEFAKLSFVRPSRRQSAPVV